MIADAAHAPALARSNPIARVTSVVFGLVPAWLPLLVLRLALARPFFASGLTRWDGWFTLSFGAKVFLPHEYKLHLFGAEIPFPMPELVATMASTAEIALPILLGFGLLTRWAALGLLMMTGIIQLTYPEGWANFHLYWAAIALAIVTFGPGAMSIDRLIGLDGPKAHVRLDQRALMGSTLRVSGEDVILVGHDRMAGEPAFGVVLLRRLVRCVAGSETPRTRHHTRTRRIPIRHCRRTSCYPSP